MGRHARSRRYPRFPFRRHHGNDEQRRTVFRDATLAQPDRGQARGWRRGARGSRASRSRLVFGLRAALRRSRAGCAQSAMSAAPANPNKKLSFVDPATFTPHFSWKMLSGSAGHKAEVYCDGVSLLEIAGKFSTPTYVYSRSAIEDAYRELASGLGALRHTLCFAVKANGNLAILEHLAKLGSGFDIVSGGELHHLQRIGVRGDRIIFSGVGKTREEMREALSYRSTRHGVRTGILLFNS